MMTYVISSLLVIFCHLGRRIVVKRWRLLMNYYPQSTDSKPRLIKKKKKKLPLPSNGGQAAQLRRGLVATRERAEI